MMMAERVYESRVADRDLPGAQADKPSGSQKERRPEEP